MKSNELYFYLTAVAAVLIVVVGSFVVLTIDFSEYKYSIVRDNIEFVSNSSEPVAALDAIRSSDTIVVSPEFVSQGEENTYMTESLTMFTTVLSAKGRTPVVLARVVDEKGNLASCTSNFGDLKRNEPVPLEDCKKMLADADAAVVLVQLPKKEQKARVVMGFKSAEIISPSSTAVPSVSFSFLKALYPDAAEVIANVNLALGGMK